jgi:two-component system, NtrC family, sensor kinase
MTSHNQEHIDVEPFDREYAIEELLPSGLIGALCAQAAPLLPDQWALCTDTGAIYFCQGPWDADQTRGLAAAVDQSHQEDQPATAPGCGLPIRLFPLIYELETKGYLAICISDKDRGRTDRLGPAAVVLLQQLMRLKHQTMLTSSLHGVVVEDSYARLKQKAEQLARSEEKYRQLAANLEIEVQKKTEEIRLAHAHLMQQEKMAAIGQLSAGMAHEINNPLGFIISNLATLKSYVADLTDLLKNYQQLTGLCAENGSGCAQAVQDQCRAIERLLEDLDGEFLLADMPQLVDESVSGAKRIQKIVRDLKTVARPGEKEQELINLHESIDAVLTIVQNRIGPNIVVSRAYSPIPLVPGYPQQINQIWLNLILNALDAMDTSGELSIATQAVKDHVRVVVRDSGSGIAPQDLPKIFDPFFTTKDVGRGMGLGLHLVYDLVTGHRGRIEVQSEPGSGSAFSVFLPAKRG